MEFSSESAIPVCRKNIPQFFAGQSVFVTGGTGFIGKALIEKLLRSCPDIDTIYLLLRPKRGQDIGQRTKDIVNTPLFDKLKLERPNAFNKLHAIAGDVSELELGMNPDDRQLLQEKVSIVFHVAANVRFEEPLAQATLINVRGTREVLRLATGIKHLKILIHISTVYCNTPYKNIEEKLYEPPMNWETLIDLVENEDPFKLQQITKKLVGNRPNTYTFTKALAEHAVNDYKDKLPVAIFRPSIVTPTYHEPMLGWIDNLYGPTGIMVGVGKGILHCVYVDEDCAESILPVDVCCKGMVIASWLGSQQRTKSLPIYNGTFFGTQHLTLRSVNSWSLEAIRKYPFSNMLYYPCYFSTKNVLVFYVAFLTLQFLPALVVDGLSWLSNRKRILMKLQRRIFNASLVIYYFAFNEWDIQNNKFLSMQQSLNVDDHETFSYKFSEDSDVSSYVKSSTIESRQYLMKESDTTLPAARRELYRMYILHVLLQVLAAGTLLWFTYSYSVPHKVATGIISIIRAVLVL